MTECTLNALAFLFIFCVQSSTDVSPSATPNSTPLVGAHAPKFGTVIPSRIFVGGIAANVSSLPCNGFHQWYRSPPISRLLKV